MDKQKIAEQLQKLDSLVFGLRMAVTALQGEFNESVTVSIKEPTEQYNTTLFEASPQSRESVYGTVPLDKHDEVERNNDEVNVKVSQTEPRYTGEAALTDYDDPDGFHGKSYRDFEKSRVLPEWKNALCAGKSLSALARR